MTRSKQFQLIDVISTLENGSRPKGGVRGIETGVPSVGGEHINTLGGFDFSEVRYVPREFYDDLKHGKIEVGDVLLVKDGATTGKVALVTGDFPFEEAAVNEHVFRIRPAQNQVSSEYLFYFLYSPGGQDQIRANFHGAAQGGINTQFAKNFLIPVPPLDQQRKVVDILRKADHLRRKRRSANELSNSLAQSIFVKMFGDPVRNPKRWKVVELGELAKKIVDGTHKTPRYVSNGVPFLTIGNMVTGEFDLSSVKYITREEHEQLIKRSKPERGDILYSKDGTLGVAKAVDIDLEFSIFVTLALIKPDHAVVNSAYLERVLNTESLRARALEFSKGIGLHHLHLEDIKRIRVPVPPLELQEKFDFVVASCKQLRDRQTESTREIDGVFYSLMQKAFKGEMVG